MVKRGTWMLLLMTMLIGVPGCRRRAPLAPGETECVTKPGMFGSSKTTCRTGQAAPAERAPIWCFTDPKNKPHCFGAVEACTDARGIDDAPCEQR